MNAAPEAGLAPAAPAPVGLAGEPSAAEPFDSPWSAAVASSFQPAAGLSAPASDPAGLADVPVVTPPGGEPPQPGAAHDGVASPEAAGDAGLNFDGDIRL